MAMSALLVFSVSVAKDFSCLEDSRNYYYKMFGT